MKNIIIFFTAILFFPIVTNANISPSDLSGLALWLDAEDVDADGDSNNNPVDGSNITNWQDKSGNNSDVISGQPLGDGNNGSTPTYLLNQFNGKPALKFVKAEKDALIHNLASPWNGEYTIFIVFKQVATPDDWNSFFSNGNSANANHFQIYYQSDQFSWLSSPVISFAPLNYNLNLYSVRGNNSTTTVYSNGIQQNSAVDTSGRQFDQYRINVNRVGSSRNDSLIAEVILYNRAITDCEMKEINQYLGSKYGQDFGGIAPGNVNNCNLQLWLKANAGISQTDGQVLSNWIDQSFNAYTASNGGGDSQTLPIFRNNTIDNINFNSVIEFDGVTNGIDLASNYIFSNNDGLTFFAVIKPDIKPNVFNFIFDFGSISGTGYGFTYANDTFNIYTSENYGGINSNFISHSYGIIPVIYTGKIDFNNEQRVYLNGTSAYNSAITTLAKLTTSEITEGSTHNSYGPVTIGRQSKKLNGTTRLFDGKIAEIILYDVDLSDANRNQVQSYLAIKYGITLDSTYVNSKGTVIYPSTTTHSNYTNDIAGIGTDIGSNLTQPKSRSVNSDSIVTITGSNITDNNFLLWGNDAGAVTFSSAEAPNIGKQLIRKWKIAETGEVGNITISFDLSNVAGADFNNASKYILLLDTDSNFSNATTIIGATINGNTVEFNNINFTDGQYFSLAYNNTPSTGFDTTLEFDGLDDYINVGSGINLANKSFTIEVWAKRSSSGSKDFIIFQDVGGTNKLLQFGFRDNDKFTCGFYDNDLDTTNTYTDNDWHHWACSYDVDTNERIIYRDGIIVAQATASEDFQGSGNLYIGGYSHFSSDYYYHGSLDEVKIWNTVRSPTEIQTFYTTTITGTEANLIGYWNFEEGSGTMTSDISSNGNDGTLINMTDIDWVKLTEFKMAENSSLSGFLVGFDADNNDSLTYSLVDDNGGAATIINSTTGEFAYNSTVTGTDTFTYKVYDGTNYSDTETVTITVVKPNLVVDNIGNENDADTSIGQNTLQEAIFYASAGDTITFDSSIVGQTIHFTEQISIDKNLTIDATGQDIILSGDSDNDGTGNVGIFYISNNANVTINSLTFTKSNIDGLYDGVINNNGSLIINNSIFSDNTGSNIAAAIQNNQNSDLEVNNCYFSNNIFSGIGASINNVASSLVVNNSTFDSNSTGNGSVIYSAWGNVTLNNITAFNNSGNAIFLQNSVTLNVNNSTIVNNIHEAFKFIYNDSTATIKNTTISGNNKGIVNAGILHLLNTVVANSIVTDCQNTGTITTNINNLIEDGSCNPMFSGDPLLDSLANNGGDTQTMALLPGSPAINAGDNTTCETADQRGETRPKHDTCDIGAYEYELLAPSNLTTNSLETQIDLSWLDNSLDETGFKIERDGNLITTIAATGYNDSDLICETIYNYSIMATNLSVDSTPITTNATTSICPPTNLLANATSDTQINLKWTDNSSTETGFKIIRGNSLLATTPANTTSYNDINLDCNETYIYSVMATSTSDSSPITAQAITLPCLNTVSYNLTISKNGLGTVTSSNGINCGVECVKSFADQTKVALIATPDNGWLFNSWTGDCDNNGEVKINSAKTCIANFIEEEVGDHQLTINITGLGTVNDGRKIDCPNSCEASFLDQETVSLTIKPEVEWILKNWSCNKQVYMDSDKICDAVFIVDPNIPNNGDGNGDGIHDADQPNIISIPDQSSGNYLTLDISQNATINKIYTDLAENQGYLDDKYIFPQGIIYFELAGTEADITIYYHSLQKLRATPIFQKFGTVIPGDINTLDWYIFPNVTFATVKIGDKSIVTATYHLKDGELGDSTGIDGKIVDPGGLAFIKVEK